MTIAKLNGTEPGIGSTIKQTAIDLIGSIGNGGKVVTRNIATLAHLSAVGESNAQELAIEARASLVDTYSNLCLDLKTKHNLTDEQIQRLLLT